MVFLLLHYSFLTSHVTFLQELKKYGVTTVVRVCEATYDATLVVKEGIQVLVSSGPETDSDPFMTLDASNQTQCRFCPFFPSQLPVTSRVWSVYLCVFTPVCERFYPLKE